MHTTATTTAKRSDGHGSGASGHLAKIKRAQKSAQRSQQKKLSKLSKYGRTEQSLQNHHVRKQIKLERESKWQHEEEDDVMRSLMERISSAAHGRMRPNMANFDGAPMDKSELKQIISVELGTTLSKLELDRIFKTFDHDQNGRIDYREVVQHLFSDLGNKESRAYLTLCV